MKALVLANGELSQPDVLKSRIQDEVFDMVIAADGSARHASTLNVSVDVIIGDLDSLASLKQQDFGNAKIISHPPEKDEIDLELVLLYAKDQGAGEIVIAGALGGRMDMTIANILLIAHEDLIPCRIEVWHGEQTAWIIRPPGEDISGHPGDTLSLLPLAGTASGVTTERLQYPLKDATLTIGPARGISNILEEPGVRVNVSEGLLLAVHTPGRA